MKVTALETLETDKKRIYAESCLIRALRSDFVISCDAIYEWKERLYIFLDYMDGNEITNVIVGYQ